MLTKASSLYKEYWETYRPDFGWHNSDIGKRRAKKSRQCLVCGGDSGCVVDRNENWVVCIRQSADIGSWSYIKPYDNTNPPGYLFKHRDLPPPPARYGEDLSPTAVAARRREWVLDRQQKEVREAEEVIAVAKAKGGRKLTTVEIDAINRYFFEQLSLSEPHQKYLLAEGLPLADVTACRTFLYADNYRLARAIVEKFGAEMCLAHPLLTLVQRGNGRNYWMIASASRGGDGLLFPAINHAGLMVGIQIRFDDKAREPRYIWLSHAGMGGTPLSYFPAPAQSANATWLMITEGYKKAAILRAKWGASVIALSGVAAWKPDELDAAIATAGGTTAVEYQVTVFDHPLGEKNNRARKNVARARQRLVNYLHKCYPSIKPLTLDWDVTKFYQDTTTGKYRAKGVDDAWKLGATFEDFTFEPAKPGLRYRWLQLPEPRTANDSDKEVVTSDIPEPTWRDEELLDETRFVAGLPLKAYQARYPDAAIPQPLYTRTEAQAKHGELMHSLLTSREGLGLKVQVASSTGGGKSHAADYEFAQASANPNGERRLVLVPDKTNLLERTRSGIKTDLGQEVSWGRVHIQKGREKFTELGDRAAIAEAELHPSPFDCRNHEARLAMESRHSPASTVCAGCPFRDRKQFRKAFPGNDEAYYTNPDTWICGERGYWHSREEADAAEAVIATAGSYLNSSDELDDFSRVVIDEGVIGSLISTFGVAAPNFAQWREAMAHFQDKLTHNQEFKGKAQAQIDDAAWEDWLKLFRALERTLVELPGWVKALQKQKEELAAATSTVPLKGRGGGGTSRDDISRLQNATELLRQIVAQDYPGDTLETLVARLPAAPASGVYTFEMPYRFEGKRLFPYRAMADLICAIQSGDARFKAERVNFGENTGSYRFLIRQIDKGLIAKLNNPAKTVVILDHTVPPELAKLLPNFKKVSYNIPQPTFVAQLTNRLYSARDLEDDKTRADMEKAIANWCTIAGSKHPLIVLPKKFAPSRDGGEDNPKALKLPEGAMWVTWGLHRASNEYEACDSVVLVGHYLEAMDGIRADMECVWDYAGEGLPADLDAQEWQIRLHNYLSKDGTAAGKWQQVFVNRELQAAIDHRLAANYIQAIGRARPGNRASDNPVPVLIASNDPVPAIKVDYLTTTRGLAKLAAATKEGEGSIYNLWKEVNGEPDVAEAGEGVTGPKALPKPLSATVEVEESELYFPAEHLPEILATAVGQNNSGVGNVGGKFVANHMSIMKPLQNPPHVESGPNHSTQPVSMLSKLPTETLRQHHPEYFVEGFTEMIARFYAEKKADALESLVLYSIQSGLRYHPALAEQLIVLARSRLDELRR